MGLYPVAPSTVTLIALVVPPTYSIRLILAVAEPEATEGLSTPVEALMKRNSSPITKGNAEMSPDQPWQLSLRT